MRSSLTTSRFLIAFLLACLLLACSGEAPQEPPSAPPAEAGPETGVANLHAPPGAADGERPRGMWVLCEGSQRILEHPERIPELMRDARDLGVSDLFVQVYRGGRAWFDSSKADASPYHAILEAHGRDSFTDLIQLAHAEGIRVHAWVNVLSLAGNRKAPVVAELGTDVVAVDRLGRSVLAYRGLELPLLLLAGRTRAQSERDQGLSESTALFIDLYVIPADPLFVSLDQQRLVLAIESDRFLELFDESGRWGCPGTFSLHQDGHFHPAVG